MSEQTTAAEPTIDMDGRPYMRDARGALVPVEVIKPIDRLMDQLVRKIEGYAQPLAEQIARFKSHSFADVDAFVALVGEQYGKKLGGVKGNTTFTTYDGCLKVQVAITDHFEYGTELQAAKALVDDCLREWSGDANVNLRAIVERAFNVDREGKINRAELLSLRRLSIDDARWIRAMEAIVDAERVIGSKRYLRIYRRPTPDGQWVAVTLDVAAA
ncbi:DUF3164 family protein [Phreatobacter stygius]|uniref:DUF3164 family protein n=1 Tax=Phreatobacter stygius TaxID=1940610 RepID=A0A4D7BCF3_9HYPH|nr:DUF3164 family protein [Phreatobacter stygius]QCI65657.1 DUF3164 family protein [Phreatobacter stygius]